jgi:hypothetical protein
VLLPDTRPSALLLSGLRRGVLLVFLPVALGGQAIAWLEYAVSGLYRPWSWAKIGVAYTLASVRVPFDVSISELGVPGDPRAPVSSTLVVAVGALTVAVLVLAYRAGLAQARGSERHPLAAALGGSAVGLGFAVPMFIVAIPVELRFPNLGISSLRPVLWAAFVSPLVVGGLAGSAGGLGGARGRLEKLGWIAHIAAAARAAAFALAWGLGLAFVGFLLLAATENGATTAYGRGVGELHRAGAVLIVHHALLLPNQSAMILATSMGAPTEVRLQDEVVASVRSSGVDVSGGFAVLLGARRGSSLTYAFPWWYRLFWVAPLLATILGGRTLTAFDADAPSRPRRARRDATLRGAMAAPIYAGLCGAAVWAASITLPLPLSVLSGALHLGADPVWTAALALAWGAVGCVIGSQLPRTSA